MTGSPDSYTTVHAGHTVLPDGAHLACSETLRFRSTDEIVAGLATAGFEVEMTWGDWTSARHAGKQRVHRAGATERMIAAP